VRRTIIQPFLLCFVFLYVFPKIGQGIGGGGGPAAESAFATILVPGVVGISVVFQGVQSIALSMAQEFGFTREIEDRVQAPCPIWLVAVAEVLSGAAQGVLSAPARCSWRSACATSGAACFPDVRGPLPARAMTQAGRWITRSGLSTPAHARTPGRWLNEWHERGLHHGDRRLPAR
jgi:hypothetical protein